LIRVTVVSANHAMRVGLRGLLANQPDIEIVSETLDLESVNEKETDVAVFAPVSSARLSETKMDFAILFLTDDVETIRAALGSDVWGALTSNATGDELAAAIRALGEGLWVSTPNLAQSLMRPAAPGRETSSGDTLVEPLTIREREVLQSMAQGLANKQMALALGISEHTIKFHLSSLYAKMNVSSRTEAIKRGIELGLISL
jgi:DNA-binding NarL/FixJ family response regulator